jgi:uncharacterized membrane protein (DUF106 family)
MTGETSDEPVANMGQMFTPLLILIGMSLLMINETIRGMLASAAGVVIEPAVPFHNELFVPTVALIGGSIMVINTVIRAFFLDPLKQAHFAHRNKQLRKLVFEAQRNRDFARQEKVQNIQNRMMPEQMEMQMATMRPMMFTMIFIIGIFSWMYTMVDGFRVDHLSLPWLPRWGFNERVLLFPAWIFAYITISAPLGRVLDRHIRLIRYRSHPLIVDGEPIPEPLAELLQEQLKESPNRASRGHSGSGKGRRQKSGKGGKGAGKQAAAVGNKFESPPRTDEVCPSCDSDSIQRAASGRLRCDVCREEWRR